MSLSQLGGRGGVTLLMTHLSYLLLAVILICVLCNAASQRPNLEVLAVVCSQISGQGNIVPRCPHGYIMLFEFDRILTLWRVVAPPRMRPFHGCIVRPPDVIRGTNRLRRHPMPHAPHRRRRPRAHITSSETEPSPNPRRRAGSWAASVSPTGACASDAASLLPPCRATRRTARSLQRRPSATSGGSA